MGEKSGLWNLSDLSSTFKNRFRPLPVDQEARVYFVLLIDTPFPVVQF